MKLESDYHFQLSGQSVFWVELLRKCFQKALRVLLLLCPGKILDWVPSH